MKRYALLAAAVATLCFGFTQTSFAQFRIDLGNGIQFDSNRGIRVDSSQRRDYHPGYGHHDEHRDHHDHYQGARRVVRYHDDHHHGHYYERGGHYYYDSGHGSPILVKYGSFSHIDDLAIRLEQLTNELCLDMYYNYRHNRGFRETYRETYEIYQLAKYIHEEEHHGHRDEIARKLGGLDALFHHIEDDVRGWHRHHHRQIGTLGIVDKMQRIEDTIHHLMNDVGVAVSGGLEEPPRPYEGEVAPRP